MLAFSFTSYDNNKLHHLHEFLRTKNVVFFRTLNQFIMKTQYCQGFSGFFKKKRMYFFQYILFILYHFILLIQSHQLHHACSGCTLQQLPHPESLHIISDFQMNNRMHLILFHLLPGIRFPTLPDQITAY